MQNIENSSDEIADAVENYSYGVRFTSIANVLLTEPNPDHNQDMQLPWSKADDGEAVKHFSAVCFMYGRNVFDVTGVPQGMVDSDWGGTVIEAWSSQDALDACNVPSNSEGDQNADTVLWNGMINPILRVSFKGFLWYQGESNSYYNRDLYFSFYDPGLESKVFSSFWSYKLRCSIRICSACTMETRYR